MERPQHYRFHQGQKALPFTADEYEARLAKLRTSMAEKGVDACVLTSMHNVAYYSGFFILCLWPHLWVGRDSHRQRFI